MKVEVLYIADCPHHRSAVEHAREALRELNLPATVDEVEVRTHEAAQALRFPGSPTVRVNGLDVEPEARAIEHFGVGCRSYLENGRRSGLPSVEMIRRAVLEGPGTLGGAPQPLLSGKPDKPASSVLFVGGLAAVLASSCCLGPLILVALGFSGAWIGTLSVLEPYRPWFIGAALIALLLAGRRIFRSDAACMPGEVCALPGVRRSYKVLFGVVSGLVVVALAYPFVAPFFY